MVNSEIKPAGDLKIGQNVEMHSSFLCRDGFCSNQYELIEKSTNLSQYHAKHSKYIVLIGFQRIYFLKYTSWSFENAQNTTNVFFFLVQSWTLFKAN